MPTLQLLNREVFLKAPPATCIWGSSFYTDAHSLELMGEGQHLQRSDTVESTTEQRSVDNGRSWSEAKVTLNGARTEKGVSRKFVFPGYVCPHTNRLVRFYNEAILPNDSPHPGEAGRLWRLYYTVSEDGGRNTIFDKVIQQHGEDFSPKHPLPQVWHGKNGFYLGALSGTPMTLDKSTFLLPLQCTVLNEEGELYCPGGGYGWFATIVMQGRWRADGDIDWEQLALLQGDPSYTTRGLIEGTIGHLDNGRLLLVMRGSNDADHNLPGHKWYCISEDGGRHWSKIAPWSYTDKSTFYSSSSCSQLVQHSSGALLWIGNISPDNPQGNWPRQPLVAGVVDKSSGLLDRDSLCMIDQKSDSDHETLQLSNFHAREDRENGDLIVHCSRLAHGSPQGWQADAMVYRIEVRS